MSMYVQKQAELLLRQNNAFFKKCKIYGNVLPSDSALSK